MSLTFQPYQDHNLDLMQACIKNWRKQNPDGTYCHPGDIPHRLYNGNRGRFLLSETTRIYSLDNTVVALLLVYPHQEGMDVFINPAFKNEADLFVPVIEAGFDIVHEHFVQEGKADSPIFVDCVDEDIALKAILKLCGFTEGKNYINETQCSLEDISVVQLPDGFTIRSATMADAEQLAIVHSKSFGSNWTAELYHDEVMCKPGYEPEREFVVVASDGTFAGFTVTWLDDVNKVGLFEPVGTHEDYRRMGLASALMTHVMHEMKQQGMTSAMVCYGTDNEASQALYTNLGFTVRHHVHEWQRTAEEK